MTVPGIIGSDNPFPSILLAEHVDPANPPAGKQRLFVDTDHILKLIDSAGTVTTFGPGFADPMTTRGDVMVRNASNVTARLGIGSSGKVLSSDGTDVSWQTPAGGGGISSGTSNPGSPTNGDLFYRSDLDLLIRYRSSGTRWVCVCPHQAATAMQTSPALLPMSANGSVYVGLDATARDLFVERVAMGTIVPSGTNNGSHFWTVAVVNVSLGGSVNTSADGNAGARHDLTGGVITAGAVYAEITLTKTGSPGNLYAFPGGLIYRYIVT